MHTVRTMVCLLAAAMACPAGIEASISKDGDPGFYAAFPAGVQYVSAGETWATDLAPANFAFVSATCQQTDTFCVEAIDLLGWMIIGDPALGKPTVLDPGYIWWQEIIVTVSCEAEVGQVNTVTAVMAYSDDVSCFPDSGDCEDPNMYGGNPYYSTTSVDLEVVEAPPALYILQDSLYFVTQGQCAAYVPFSICNSDPCAPVTDFICEITSTGHVGGAIDQMDTVSIEGGACEDVYGVVNARYSNVCTFDTLTIVAWDAGTGTIYDTCTQLVHILEPF